MLHDRQKRSSSLGKSTMSTTSSTVGKQTPNLIWSDWAKSPFLDYLNLIDYDYKKKSSDAIPWFQTPFSQSEITKYCLRSIYSLYKHMMMINISKCDRQELSTLIQKILYVYRLININCDIDESPSYLYYHIAYNLLDKDCDDPTIFLSLWRTLCVTEKAKVSVFSGIIGSYRKRKAVKLFSYIMKAANTIRFDFWGAWNNGNELNSLDYCPLTAALLTGSLEQMVILLQYGFEPHVQRLCGYDNHFLTQVDIIYDWIKQPLVEKMPTRRTIIAEVLLFLINVARCNSRTKRVAMVKCFFLLWSVLPTPFVTSQELRNEVHRRFDHPPIFRGIFYPGTENQFLELCDYYAKNIEIVEVLQPRSLMHLSKCVIRRQLRKAWSLPYGITKLYLPRILESYLQVATDL